MPSIASTKHAKSIVSYDTFNVIQEFESLDLPSVAFIFAITLKNYETTLVI